MTEIQIFGGPKDGDIVHYKGDIPPMTICVLEPLEVTITRPGESMIPEIVGTKIREMPVMKRNNGKYYARWDHGHVR